MASRPVSLHQIIAGSLADDCQSSDKILANAARLLAASETDWTASERQFFYDLQRLDSSERRRAAFHVIDRFTEMAARAPEHVAFGIAEGIRRRIIALRQIQPLDMRLVMKVENEWNYRANHDELLYGFEQDCPARVEALEHSWGGQLEATRTALDHLRARHTQQRLISVPRS